MAAASAGCVTRGKPRVSLSLHWLLWAMGHSSQLLVEGHALRQDAHQQPAQVSGPCAIIFMAHGENSGLEQPCGRLRTRRGRRLGAREIMLLQEMS